MKPVALYMLCTLASSVTFATLAAAQVHSESSYPSPSQRETLLDGFDSYMAQVMNSWKVPGAAVVIVDRGEVVLSKGYGFRDLSASLPATPHTRFAIGSITKSFNVAVLGMLVDEGKLDWDKPVLQYLPDFRMYNQFATESITIRDLVTHRTGLPRHDMVAYTSDFSRREIVRRLRYLQPSADVRTLFQYSNLMYVVAGCVAEQVSGMRWEDLVTERVLHPLGMTETNFSISGIRSSSDFALPYKQGRDRLAQVDFLDMDSIGPAGEINSTIADLARYLMFHINRGRVEDKRLLTEYNSLQMQTTQIAIPGPPEYDDLGPKGYGMGFYISTYRGHKLVEHSGDTEGFAAELAFLPEQRSGVVILTNLNNSPLRNIVAYNVLDRLLGLAQASWSLRFEESRKRGQPIDKGAFTEGDTYHKSSTRPSHEVSSYVGEYTNPGYGTANISVDGQGNLRLRLNRRTRALRHFHYDVFEIPDDPLDPLQRKKVIFLMDHRGDIRSLTIPLESRVSDIVFTRMPSPEMAQKSFLEPLAGTYEIPGGLLTISLYGTDKLLATFTGFSANREPPRELIPVRGMIFEFLGLHDVSIEFKKDESGRVSQAIFVRGPLSFNVRKRY